MYIVKLIVNNKVVYEKEIDALFPADALIKADKEFEHITKINRHYKITKK
jgi:hypothetical protein